jgi:hypothetical protein
LIACEIRQEFGDADEGAWKRERKCRLHGSKLQKMKNEVDECLNSHLYSFIGISQNAPPTTTKLTIFFIIFHF